MMRASRLLVAAALAALVIQGCKTVREPKPEGAVTPGEVIPFTPARAMAPLQFDSGPYPNLYGPASYALWVTDELNAARVAEARVGGESPAEPLLSPAEAAALDARFLVIECHFESAFGDSAIGYDVVAMQGVDAYLEMADGAILRPARVALGGLSETPQGALRHFERTVLAGFPRDMIDLTVPREEALGASMRLVVESHGTKFYFEWFPVLPDIYVDTATLTREYAATAKMPAKDFYLKVKGWAHTFD